MSIDKIIEALTKFLDALKNAKTKTIVLFLSCLIVISSIVILQRDNVVAIVDLVKNGKRSFNTIKTGEILDDNIVSILSEKLNSQQQLIKYLAVFKFQPTGEEYQYQGRVLIGIAHRYKMSNSAFIENLNYGWIPLWSGKAEVEEVLARKTVLIKADLNGVEPIFTINDKVHTIQSVTSSFLTSLDVNRFFLYPMIYKNRVVAYIAIAYHKDIHELSNEELIKIAKAISRAIFQFVVED